MSKQKETRKKLKDVTVRILKMKESSGNEQFFIQLIRTDIKGGFLYTNHLDHSCWQTKDFKKEECLSRAWFDASFLARFVGLESMEEIVLVGIDEDEEKTLKESLALKF